MFIIHGHYNREKDRGVVADKCLHCAQVSLLRVTQHYKVGHLYFIPLGSGELIGTVLTCKECGGTMTGVVEVYARVLPREVSTRMTLGQVLAETNPRLNEEILYRASLEQKAREAMGPGMPDPRVELAFARLADLNHRHPEVIRLHSRLAQWSLLDPAAQAQLLRDLDAVAQDQERDDAALRFVRLMGQQFTPDVDAFLSVLLCVVVAAVGTAGSVLLFSDGAFIAGGVLASIVVGGIASFFFNRAQRRYSHRKFFRKTFLPEAHYHDVDVVRTLGILQEPPPSVAHDPGVANLAASLPILHQVLKDAHPEGEIADAVATLAESYPKSRGFRRKPINWMGPTIVIGIVALIIGGSWWMISNEREKQRIEAERRNAFAAPFVAKLPEYLPAAPQRDLQPPYRHGLVVTINYDIKAIDSMLLDLPPGLRPDKPEDVGTILWLQWGRQVVGRYADGMEAFVITCKVTLIDKSKGIIVAEQGFVGGQPPATRRKHTDPNTGGSPTNEIINWLRGLPVK